MTDPTSVAERWVPEVLVRVYRGDHLIEQRFCDSAETVAGIVESWQAHPSPEGELIVVEPRPSEAIVALLRAIADAIEQERPVAMQHPLPQMRLQLVTAGTEPGSSGRGQLSLLRQEQAHPGG